MRVALYAGTKRRIASGMGAMGSSPNGLRATMRNQRVGSSNMWAYVGCENSRGTQAHKLTESNGVMGGAHLRERQSKLEA